MTSNQLSYQRNLIAERELGEKQRSNLANEALKQSSVDTQRMSAIYDIARDIFATLGLSAKGAKFKFGDISAETGK